MKALSFIDSLLVATSLPEITEGVAVSALIAVTVTAGESVGVPLGTLATDAGFEGFRWTNMKTITTPIPKRMTLVDHGRLAVDAEDVFILATTTGSDLSGDVIEAEVCTVASLAWVG